MANKKGLYRDVLFFTTTKVIKAFENILTEDQIVNYFNIVKSQNRSGKCQPVLFICQSTNTEIIYPNIAEACKMQHIHNKTLNKIVIGSMLYRDKYKIYFINNTQYIEKIIIKTFIKQ
jgi:hypothetical protein